jgi:hypothetical protein
MNILIKFLFFFVFRKCLNPVKVDIVNLSTKPFIEDDNLGYKTNVNLIDNCKAYTDTINKVFGNG